jgi:DNA ligase-1
MTLHRRTFGRHLLALLGTFSPFIDALAKTSPGVLLAHNAPRGLSPVGYLVSEKLDGVRALWDGQTLRFRSGRPIAAPVWFLAGLPNVALDGELWAGRGSFEVLSGSVRKTTPVDAEWRKLRYMVFDLPHDPRPFAERAKAITELLAMAKEDWLQAVLQSKVADLAALQARLDAVLAGGGEGLVLHRMDALWRSGRSDAVRKLKAQPDEEGLVLAQMPGTGKYQGRMGALLLKAPDGQQFSLGTGFSDAQRAEPPTVGSWVTYRYRGRTASGLPRFASFVRLREAE